MASEIIGDGDSFMITLESYIRGHHVYHTVWTPIINKSYPSRESYYDRFAVAVLKGGEVVGHVPRTLSKTNSFFLRYDDNMVFCEVTGEQVNQLGVEVPCVYKFYGCRSLITKQR